ncbi:mechanosensitive ion channel family protein [Natrialba swarupiae]|uniref:Mechanosensitive ion channel family protein n=1 Tax=Natrialba swarupiae TaxID=2448032 RepID=A0A5D5AFG8_9EURY|nr:mechanosensitive ion channel family protein [Natrialba swarupiae]
MGRIATPAVATAALFRSSAETGSVSVTPSSIGDEDVHPAAVADVVDVLELSWLLAGLAVVAAWYGSKFLTDRLRPRLEERVLRPTTANAVLLIVRIGIVCYAFVPFAGLLGFRPQNVLLSFTVLSLVLGAVLAPVGRSYVSGLFILVNRPYEVGDMIELVDREERGYVDDISLGYTRIYALDNSFLVIPNETMRERDVRNRSAEDERNRLSLEVCVTYEGDLERACSLLERSARRVDGVIEGGPPIRIGRSRFPAGPTAFVREFADHGILIDLKLWTEEPYLPLKVRSAVHRNAWNAFEGEDVEIAYPHTHHVFDETSGRARVAFEPPDGEPSERSGDTSGLEGNEGKSLERTRKRAATGTSARRSAGHESDSERPF